MLRSIASLCYRQIMPETRTKPTNAPPKSTNILGRDWFAKIGAVEGISLSEQQNAILAALDERGLTGNARQLALRDLLTRS
jgi:hypothetical protein